MTAPTLSDRLRATFLTELEEQLRVMNDDLLALESDPRNADRLRSLFRVAHTLKGAARAVGVPSIAQACHALETMLARVRAGHEELGPAHFQILFATADALAEAREQMRSGHDPTVFARLSSLPDAVASTIEPPKAPPVEPAPKPPPTVTAEPATAEPAQPDVRARASRTDGPVRVDQRKLDSLLASVEQLLIAVDTVTETSRENDALAPAARALARASDEVANATHQLRLRPFAEACEALPRVVRDLSTAVGKDVRLELNVGDVYADRAVVDGLREPLVHLVRNAVDHGIESGDRRARAGKPSQGVVAVSAEVQGDQVCITVSDDGAGIDVDAVRRSLSRAGRTVPASDRDVVNALFEGGVSTRSEASEISGRGVGLDLVRAAVERIRGSVDVDWRAGEGTTFTLRAPLTLIRERALLVRVSGQTIAFPTVSIERVVRVAPSEVGRAEGRDVIPGARAGEPPLTVVSLAQLLGPPLTARPYEARTPALIVNAQSQRLAIVVDELVTEQEIIVRPLEIDGAAIPHVSGVAILAAGKLALVVNPQSLVTAGRADVGGSVVMQTRETDAKRAPRILVVDDSITTRTLEQGLLEAAGYRVFTAVDGAAAWAALQEQECDLVVADVEMPRMDGFALCRAIRSSDRLRKLPVVLVTGLEKEEHRARGLEAGADAYLGKSSFDRRALLDVIEELIDR